MNFDEDQIIASLAKIFATSRSGVEIGIGDDAAVVAASERIVLTTDMAVEGTHFNKEWSSAFEIGRKICAANLADIYAMGATPKYLLVAVSLRGDESLEWIEELAQGIAHEGRSCGAQIVGGDIARGESVVIAITAVGEAARNTTRSGARVGDEIYISSLPGWSAAGLFLSAQGGDYEGDFEQYALSEFSAPTVDYQSAIAFARAGASAMCDISDALIIQGQQLAQASGVALAIDQSKIARHPEFAQLQELADSHGQDVWQWALAGGEDHVFLATGRDLGGFSIGQVQGGAGLLGVEMKKAPENWRHFN